MHTISALDWLFIIVATAVAMQVCIVVTQILAHLGLYSGSSLSHKQTCAGDFTHTRSTDLQMVGGEQNMAKLSAWLSSNYTGSVKVRHCSALVVPSCVGCI